MGTGINIGVIKIVMLGIISGLIGLNLIHNDNQLISNVGWILSIGGIGIVVLVTWASPNPVSGDYSDDSDDETGYSDTTSTTEKKGSMSYVTHIKSKEIGDVIGAGWSAEEAERNACRLNEHYKERRNKR
jgi:hypothetical protein